MGNNLQKKMKALQRKILMKNVESTEAETNFKEAGDVDTESDSSDSDSELDVNSYSEDGFIFTEDFIYDDFIHTETDQIEADICLWESESDCEYSSEEETDDISLDAEMKNVWMEDAEKT